MCVCVCVCGGGWEGGGRHDVCVGMFLFSPLTIPSPPPPPPLPPLPPLPSHTHSECSVYEMIQEVLQDLASRRTLPNVALLTRDLHVLPDVLGNRSPLADPTIRGMASLT